MITSALSRDKQSALILEATLKGISSNLNRIKSIADPVLKYRLTTELFHSMFTLSGELASSMLANYLEDLDVIIAEARADQEKNSKSDIIHMEKTLFSYRHSSELLENILKNFDKHMDGLGEWIQQPIYSPDHPNGKEIMEKSKNDMQNLTKKEID